MIAELLVLTYILWKFIFLYGLGLRMILAQKVFRHRQHCHIPVRGIAKTVLCGVKVLRIFIDSSLLEMTSTLLLEENAHKNRRIRKIWGYEGGNSMDFYKVPIGFGMALAQNEAAMIRYAQLSDFQKKNILSRAHSVRSEEEMYSLVAGLANGTMS